MVKVNTEVNLIEEKENGIKIFSIENEKLQMKVSNIGCRIMEVSMPNENGSWTDVLLGLKNIEDYKIDSAFLGVVVGRVANRIKAGHFELNGKEYNLAKNNNGNHLHGGDKGFDKVIFQDEILDDGIKFTYLSPDGEEGYPGNLTLNVSYTLDKDTLSIQYEASCDQDTVANFTNHMYCNLSGKSDTIEKHLLKVDADEIGCVDADGMTTGEKLNVKDTPFDFRKAKAVGAALKESHIQLDNANGIDHPYILNSKSNQIILEEPESRRRLTISTDTPAVHVYTGNFLAEAPVGKIGKKYNKWAGIALETEFMPNAINTEDRESVILRKGESYFSKSTYKFENF